MLRLLWIWNRRVADPLTLKLKRIVSLCVSACVCMKQRGWYIVEGLASPELPAAPLLLISGQARLAELPKKKHCLRWSSHLPNCWKRKREKNGIVFLLNCTVKKKFVFLSFKIPKHENRPAAQWGGFLRLITFPFCPTALAHFIQQTDLPDQWSQNASYTIYMKEREEMTLLPHLQQQTQYKWRTGDFAKRLLRLVRTSSSRLIWVIHWFSNSINTKDQLQQRFHIVENKKAALFW